MRRTILKLSYIKTFLETITKNDVYYDILSEFLISVEGFHFEPPATIEEISNLEKVLGWKLPASYVEFLKLYNGAIFFYDIDGGQDGIYICGTKSFINPLAKREIADYITNAKILNIMTNNMFLSQISPFGGYFGTDDYPGFTLNSMNKNEKQLEYRISGVSLNSIDEPALIANTFESYIHYVLKCVGKRWWLFFQGSC